MPSTEQALESFCCALDSNRLTERKKAVEELSLMLQDAETLQILNKNTRKNAGGKVGWDEVFNAAHRMAIQEARRIHAEIMKKESPSEVMKSNWANTKSACGSFIVLVVTKANLGEPRLRCSDLISSVKTVLSSGYLMECYVRSYMHILDRHVLLVRKYWADAKPTEWEELMDKFWQLLDLTPPCINKALVTSVLRRIIKCGAQQSHLVLKLRTRFKNLVKAFKDPDIKNNDDMQCNLLKLSIMVCELVSKESRTLVCEFGEEVLMAVIHLYEHRIERTAGKKSLMFAWLALQVRLHHPHGAKQGEATAYADNWSVWNKQCLTLYTVVEAEVRSLKRRTPLLRDFALPANFLQLAVVVCKQVYGREADELEVTQLTVLNETVDVSMESVPKKRRLDGNLQTRIEELRSCNDVHIILPWLAILTELLSTYPSLVKYADLLPMLTLVSDLQAVCDEPVILQYLCRYCITLLKVDAELDSNLLDDTSSAWGKIVETAVRLAGLSQCEEAAHLLLQALLTHHKLPVSSPLLQLYTSHCAKLSGHAVRTLAALCRCRDVLQPAVRLVLLDWLLPWPAPDLPPLTLADALVELILNTKPSDRSRNLTDATAWDASTSPLSAVEDFYILCSFETDIFSDKTEAPRNIGEKLKSRVNCAVKDRLVELLKRSAAQQEDRMLMPPNEVERMSAVLGLVSNMALLASVLSVMVGRGVITDAEVSEHTLSDTVRSLLVRVSSFVTPLVKKRDGATYRIVEQFRSLVDLELEPQVARLVRRSLPVCLVEAMFTLLPYKRVLSSDQVTEDEEASPDTSVIISGSDGSQEVTFETAGNIRLQALMMLKSYICGSGSPVDDQQHNLMNEVLDQMASKEFNYKEECDFTMAEEMLNGVVRLETISSEAVHRVLKVLQAMCVARYQECHVASSVLTIVAGLVRHVSAVGSNASKQNTVIIMQGFRSGIKKKKYGMLAYSKFLSCLAEFVKVDPVGSWARWNGCNTLLGEDILTHMTSMFHQIRMECAQHMRSMFSSSLDDAVQLRQKELFTDVCTEVNASFSVNDDLPPRVMADEGVNRTASALHTVASLIVASPVVHRKALFFFLLLVHKKNINLDLAAKVLKLVGAHFKLADETELLKFQLKFCIHHWLAEDFHLQSFPYKLVGCTSLQQFYGHYKNVLVAVSLKHEDDDVLNDLAQTMDVAVLQLVMVMLSYRAQRCDCHMLCRFLISRSQTLLQY